MNYEYPNTLSFGNTARQQKEIEQDKKESKAEELKQEEFFDNKNRRHKI